MAGEQLSKVRAFRSSTILEVVVAMVLIVAVFGIAMMIFANVTRSSLSYRRLKAEALLKNELIRIAEAPVASEMKTTKDELSISISVKAYPGNADLLQADLSAYDQNGRQLAELHQILVSESN